MTDILPTLFTSYLSQAPLWLVWLAGFILALVWWQRHPKVSLLAIIATAIMFLSFTATTFLTIWLPWRIGYSPEIGYIFGAMSFINSILRAVAWGLLLAAVFGWRKEAGAYEKQDQA